MQVGNARKHPWEDSMKTVDSSWPNVLDYYLLSDQPMTCGMCGSRTLFHEDENGIQMHSCLNSECGYRFIAIDDAD